MGHQFDGGVNLMGVVMELPVWKGLLHMNVERSFSDLLTYSVTY